MLYINPRVPTCEKSRKSFRKNFKINVSLKGLSREMNLAFDDMSGQFSLSLGDPMILYFKKCFLAANASLRWLNIVRRLFLSFLLIKSGL
jgi:hypothetical protein